ncbi:hypothetical protein ACQ5SO_03735 [Rhodovulum sp. DZ06]|uniref:hypothetical protein n=1 Tax=Rhodovulum sp. DZ06 TaxID=3425126 RepID=UPI003D3388C9
MSAALEFSPLLPLPVIAVLAALSLLAAVLHLWRGSPGWGLRALAALAILAALAGPSLKQEIRDPLPDVAFLVVDESASNRINGRDLQAQAAAGELSEELAALGADPTAPLEWRLVTVRDAPEGARGADKGTQLVAALEAASAEVAPDRIAGAILVTDGRAHDSERFDGFPAPVHVLLTGRADEWDRRLVLETAPAFGLVGDTVQLQFRVEALGEAPPEVSGSARVDIQVDGKLALSQPIPVGRQVTLALPVEHGGANVVSLSIPAAEGELTDRNNAAVFTINGVRDRLRVLLVSGEPHPGERTWRNLLKADPSVDLVHFTILRPPTKQDGVPVFELSLISFPTRELFMEKIDEFDLIIFDRYRRRGVLPDAYIRNVARYVENGGAVLVASGPAFAGVESLWRTPLQTILPGAPTPRVIERGFLPEITEVGLKHPVTAGLLPEDLPEGEAPWGRWFRMVQMERASGEAVMQGAGAPLLILDRVGEGRVAALASDHAWLWSRGYEGGGPQAELLRRLAHWLMKEPELEEEALTAEVSGDRVRVSRRSLSARPTQVTAAAPSGALVTAVYEETAPGRWTAEFEAREQGLWRLSDGTLEAVAAVGPPAPKEFENPISSAAPLEAAVDATGGGALRLGADGAAPDLRRVREERVSAGRGWIGLARREAYAVRDVSLTPLAPGWLMLALAGLLTVGAWRVEGR